MPAAAPSNSKRLLKIPRSTKNKLLLASLNSKQLKETKEEEKGNESRTRNGGDQRSASIMSGRELLRQFRLSAQK